MTVEAAYVECARITREEARNFYYGIRLLPEDKRSALCAVYALARRIDDIGDGPLPPQEKSRQLAELRRALQGPLADDPVLAAVGDSARRFPLPLGAFGELIDGVESDVVGRRYETFDELVGYCRCVAGSVGRLCLGVFGTRRPDPLAATHADTLGIALQQANILRDVREDLQAGRVYLPQEDLDRWGVTLELDEHGNLADPEGRLRGLVRESAQRAALWFDEGLRLVPLLDRRSAASCSAMAGIYRRLLTQIEQDPTLVYDRRLSLTGREKASVAARALVGRAA